MRKTILLSGASGFLGSHLLENFIKKGHKVIALVRSTSDLWRINEFLPDFIIYEIDKISIDDIFKESTIDLVVHTACTYGRKGDSISSIIDTNLKFGLQILETAIAHNVKTFINTDTLLPKDVNAYSLSKAQFRDWSKFLSKDIQVINMRMEHMYGPKDDKNKFIAWLINQMLDIRIKEIDLTSGSQKRDFIYIEDVVNAYSIIINKKDQLPRWKSFDVGTNSYVTVKEFVLLIADHIEKYLGIEVFNRLNFGSIQYRKGDIMEPLVDNRDLIALGWNPGMNINQGINKMLVGYVRN